MVVRLHKDGRFLLGEEVLDAARLEHEAARCAVLSPDSKGRSTVAINIVADRRCRASSLVELIEAARRGGVSRFRLIAMSSQSGRGKAFAKIRITYPNTPGDAEELLPGPEDSVQDVVRELDKAWSSDNHRVVIGRYKLD